MAQLNKEQKQLLKEVAELYKLSDKEYLKVLKQFKESRNNINQLLINLFINHSNDNDEIDFHTVFGNGSLQEIDDEIDQELHKIGVLETAVLTSILFSTFKNGYYRTAFSIENTFKINLDFNRVNERIISQFVNKNWSGIPFSQRIWRNKEALRQSLKNNLHQAIRNGDNLNKIAKIFRDEFDVKAYEAQRLARTETARVLVESREKIYEESGIKQVQYLATLEDDTCDDCAEYDGQIFDINDSSRPSTPIHPNCRCDYSPYFDEYELKTRKDNETKEYVNYQNYEEWSKAKDIN